jgi:hypothetical protein
MATPTSTPVYANIAYFRIPLFDTRTVAEQASQKGALEARVREALAKYPAGDRVVLDADDGMALVLFGDQAATLDLVQAIHAKEPLHAGLNYGPLALSSRGSDARVFGDGLVAAAAAARFSQPEKLLVTQDFAKALEATSPERAAELETAGEFTDTRVRLHSFYTPDKRKAVAHRRRMMAYSALGVFAILFAGVIAREAIQRFFPPAPAVLTLLIKPRGEIFIDGVSRGKTPPVTEIQVTPGPHLLEIRAPGQPPLKYALNLEAGERMTITHTFGSGKKPTFWQELQRKFKGS